MKHLAAAALALCLTGCTIGQTRVTFGLTTLADAGTTAAGLNGGASEGNPVLREAPVPIMLVLSGVVALCAEYDARHGNPRRAMTLYRIGSIVHSIAAAWNVYSLGSAHHQTGGAKTPSPANRSHLNSSSSLAPTNHVPGAVPMAPGTSLLLGGPREVTR